MGARLFLMQRWKLISAAVLFAGMAACAMVGSGQQRQSAHTQNSTADKTEAAASQNEKPDPRAQITRENNFGVALMNRQQFEKALGKFQRACIIDPDTDTGCLNAGIALLNMQRYDDPRMLLEKSAKRDPQNPRVWFNLGLLEKAAGNSEAAIGAFRKAAALDSYDADTQYFIGLIYSQQQQYDQAIAAFRRAISLNPFQVSAEFGLAQALQRTDDTAHAKEHFDKFQHLTSQKLGKPVSFIYGEQGKYSLAEILQPAPEPVPPAMPIHFVNVTGISGLAFRGQPAEAATTQTPIEPTGGAAGGSMHNTMKPRRAPVKKNDA